ncbi:MAG: hydroxymethylbilane synthase [Candidatus Omnitrophota bacterium]
MKRVRLGSRPSRLASIQADEIISRFPNLSFQKIFIATDGDLDKTTPLSKTEGSDFFTRQLEQALIDNKIDAAVHSAKDLAEVMPPQLMTAVVTLSLSPYECLVSQGGKKINELPSGARVGTSSQKRQAALRRYRQDLIICDLRGDIEERLQQLDEGRFDAIIMAHAALIRLGYENRIAEIISSEIIPPHPLQGSLAVQVRRDDEEMLRLLGGKRL